MPLSAVRPPYTGTEWSREDRMLLVALQVYEDSLCSCGHPIDEAWNPAGPTSYEPHKTVCRACAAREKAGEEENRPAGRKVWVSDNQHLDDDVDAAFAPVFDQSGGIGGIDGERSAAEGQGAENGAADHGAE